ncbi:MAG: hypothetical protein ACI9WU_005468 [Myxococcota bacterium]|jgi:hypothetical protein
MIHEQDRMLGLAKEVLGEEFMRLELVGYDLHEDFHREVTRIACKIKDEKTGKVTVIEGVGVGMIDAFFHAMLDTMSEQYPSLDTISIDKFQVTAKIGSGSERNQGDAIASVTIGIRNSSGKHFEFEHESRSVTRSGIEATLRAGEYFVNSEKAFIEAYTARTAAKESNRQDLINRYTALMADLVKNTSYSRVIEQIRSEMDD